MEAASYPTPVAHHPLRQVHANVREARSEHAHGSSFSLLLLRFRMHRRVLQVRVMIVEAFVRKGIRREHAAPACSAGTMQQLGSAVLDVLLGEYIENLDQRQLELDVLDSVLKSRQLCRNNRILKRHRTTSSNLEPLMLIL